MTKDILSRFPNPKPIIGVLHAKGDSDASVMERAKREIALYVENGVDGIIAETYFGNYDQVSRILAYMQQEKLPLPYGVNCLNVDAMGFDLANAYNCAFLQIDSVIGHVKPRDEASLAAFFSTFRARSEASLLGGVRFKYQPVLSAHSVEEDLIIAMGRCDCICVTQDATGQETSLDRIAQFRRAIGAFPLFVCAGVTPENAASQLAIADGAVVGSCFKDTRKDSGDVCKAHIIELMRVVSALRESL